MDDTELSEEDKLRARVAELEASEVQLLQEKKQLEEDFGHRRAKLKDLYLQKEEELKLQNDKNSLALVESEDLREQMRKLELELEEARSAAIIAQCTAENSVAVEKRKFEEEIATLNQLMQEGVRANERYEEEFRRLKKYGEKLDLEKQHYRQLYEQKLEEMEGKSRGDSLLNPNVLSVMTKSLAKRVPSLSPAHSSALDKVSSQGASGGPNGPSSETVVSPMTDENLEHSMIRAQEDTALLKSLLVPLEEEIRALKEKIRAQDAQLRTYEAKMNSDIQTSDVLGPLLEGRPVADVVQDLDQRLKGVSSTLEAEKSSRADLELYTAILNTQKAAMSKELDNLKSHMKETIDSLDTERRQHRELKDTWQKANDQFLAAQRCHISEMQRIRSIMNAEQLTKLNEIESAQEDWMDTIASPVTKQHPMSFEKSETKEDTFEEESPNEESTREGELDARYSPEKMPTLSEEQKKALLEPTSTEMDFKLKSEVVDNCRTVSETEWQRLMKEVQKARTGLSRSCPGCTELKKNLSESNQKVKEQEGAINRQRDDLDRESKYRKEAEKKWKEQAETFERKEQELRKVVEQSVKQNAELLAWKTNAAKKINEKIASLADKRIAVQQELERLQNENDTLIGRHSAHSEELQNEIINLPESNEEMQLLLLRYREDVIAAKVAKEHLEQTLNSKIIFHSSQLEQERHERAAMEEKLNVDLEQTRIKLEELEKRLDGSEDYEKRIAELNQSHYETNKRNLHVIAELKTQLSSVTNLKNKLDQELNTTKGKITALQHDLGNSEVVQRDFVRLSQNLQVQLEKIRQSEKEVRWQHVDDIDDCNSCKQRFTSPKQKNHCNHCGKIFCPECLAKSVPSGPKARMVCVCDVCHTLLVQDATPYFSTELPQSPG